jgi:hypothetical protein
MTQADSVLSTPPTNTPVDTHDAAPFGKAAACSRSAFSKIVYETAAVSQERAINANHFT